MISQAWMKVMKPSNLPRIYVLLAREAPLGVIIRRGPSKMAQLVLWRTDTDQFEFGQWFKGRIHERRCDLSPSGKYFIYFGGKEKPPMYKWTAISHPPYFTALALWDASYHIGGGVFESDSHVIVNQHLRIGATKDELPDLSIKVESTGFTDWEPETLLLQRLVRNGWQITNDKNGFDGLMFKCHVYENEFKAFLHLSMKYYNSDDRCKEDFLVAGDDGNTIVEMKDIEWADFDKNGDLLFARGGKVFRLAQINEAPYLPPIENAKELLDLSKYSFEEVPPPSWAKKW
jgi:hypothetical protein